MIPAWLTSPNPEIYLSDNYIVIDWETTNLNKGDARLKDNKIVLGSFYLGKGHPSYTGKIKTIHGGEFQQQEIVQAIQDADFMVAQNTKFELKWLVRCGLDLTSVLSYDTIIGEYVLDGNRVSARDLGSLARKYSGSGKESVVDIMIKGGVCPSIIPKYLLQRYCEKDVDQTHKIFLKQRMKLHHAGLLPVTFTRNIFTPVLVDIELNGMFLDKARVQEMYTEKMKELQQCEQELNQLAQINWGSPQQVATYVYETLGFKELTDRKGMPIRNKANKKFPNGAPITDSDTLTQLIAETPEQEKFITLKKKYSKVAKMMSTYLNKFKEACDENDGYLYSTFNQTVTATHRLSSSSPNFQNFDRTLKKLFTSRGTGGRSKVGERDAAQLEFRVAAELGNDEVAKASILNKEDVHGYTASIIFTKIWNKVKDDKESKKREEIRTESKAHTFKPLFGGTSGTKEEQRYYAAFKEKYHQLAAEQDAWVNTALIEKKYRMCTGLIFYYPDVKMTATGYIQGNTNVRNYPIQNLATAEIIPIGVTMLWHNIKRMKLNTIIINTVHDSIITDEDPTETEVLNELTSRIFKNDVIHYLKQVYNITFSIPLEIDNKIKTHWSYEWAQQ
jgi:DNA polymerase I